jgi:hypothetical protein
MVAPANSAVTSWAMVAKAQNIDLQHLAGAARRFEILAGVISQTEVQALPSRGLLDDVRVAFELVPNGRPDEIRPVRIEPFLHHEIDVTEVDIAKVDRDLLSVGGLGSQLAHISSHESPVFTIHWDGVWLLHGCYVTTFKGAAAGCAKTPPVSRARPAVLRLLNGKQLLTVFAPIENISTSNGSRSGGIR